MLRQLREDGRTSFCEQKEAKKLYDFSPRCLNNYGLNDQKFFGSFFQKRTAFFLQRHSTAESAMTPR